MAAASHGRAVPKSAETDPYTGTTAQIAEGYPVTVKEQACELLTSMMSLCRARVMNLKEGRSAGLCDQQASMRSFMPLGVPSGMGGR